MADPVQELMKQREREMNGVHDGVIIRYRQLEKSLLSDKEKKTVIKKIIETFEKISKQ